MNAPRCEDCRHSEYRKPLMLLFCNHMGRGYGNVFAERDYGSCGPQGRYFKPRFWVRLRKFFKRKEERNNEAL